MFLTVYIIDAISFLVYPTSIGHVPYSIVSENFN